MTPHRKLFTFVLLSATVIHILIAWSLWLTIYPENPTPSQLFLRQFVPDETWPILFFTCGITAAYGLLNSRVAQFHFSLAGTLMVIWASIAIFLSGSPVINAGGLLLLHVGVLKYSFAFYTPRLQRTQRATTKLLEEVSHAKDDLETHGQRI